MTHYESPEDFMRAMDEANDRFGYVPGKNGTAPLEEALFWLNGICDLLTTTIINLQVEEPFERAHIAAWPVVPNTIREMADLIESTEIYFKNVR